MEDGGTSLFKFITDAHKLIQLGKLDVSHWKEVVKFMFKQMVECIDYLHGKGICHFDISLENFLINDVPVELEESDDGEEKIRFFMDEIQIKLCDFGMFFTSLYDLTLLMSLFLFFAVIVLLSI